MLSVEETLDRIVGRIEPLAPIELPLAEAVGSVLAHDAVGEYDLPPFSSASVEGFAARAADTHEASPQAPARLTLVGPVRESEEARVTVGWGEAVRVPAGAPIPAGADCVVPYDRVRVGDGAVFVGEPAREGALVRPAGEDLRAGEVLVPAGRRLSAPELGLLALSGFPGAFAHPKVRVAVMSVGDLVEPGRSAPFGAVPDAASFSLLAEVRDAGAVPYRAGIVSPRPRALHEVLLENAARADCFVAAGAADRETVSTLGQVEPFEVAMYPGPGVAFGFVEGKPFIGLPGGPVSLFVGFEVFARPALLRIMGRRDLQRPEVRAVLDEPIGGPAGVTLFVPAAVRPEEGRWHVRPTAPASEDRLGSLVRANGLVLVPPGNEEPSAGDAVRVRLFRALSR